MLKITKLNMALLGILLTGPVAAYAAAGTTVTSSLDSAYIIMGKQTELHLQVVQNHDDIGHWPSYNDKMLTPEVYIINQGTADTTDLGNGRIQIDRSMVIQSFDSGLYMLPPISYVINNDTMRSSQLALKVVPIDIDTMTQIHPMAGTVSIPRKWYDFLPDFIVDYWAWFVSAIIILAGAYAFYWSRKHGIKTVFKAPEKPIPPYEMAMRQLEVLRNRKLCERGQEKEYYTELTDILRVYLDRRFGINAMEMTTTQIKRAVRDNEATRPSTEQMSRILEMADYVKFAKVRPLPEDNARAFSSAIQFVEDTKPAPEPEPETTDVKPENPAQK